MLETFQLILLLTPLAAGLAIGELFGLMLKTIFFPDMRNV